MSHTIQAHMYMQHISTALIVTKTTKIDLQQRPEDTKRNTTRASTSPLNVGTENVTSGELELVAKTLL